MPTCGWSAYAFPIVEIRIQAPKKPWQKYISKQIGSSAAEDWEIKHGSAGTRKAKVTQDNLLQLEACVLTIPVPDIWFSQIHRFAFKSHVHDYLGRCPLDRTATCEPCVSDSGLTSNFVGSWKMTAKLSIERTMCTSCDESWWKTDETVHKRLAATESLWRLGRYFGRSG